MPSEAPGLQFNAWEEADSRLKTKWFDVAVTGCYDGDAVEEGGKGGKKSGEKSAVLAKGVGRRGHFNCLSNSMTFLVYSIPDGMSSVFIAVRRYTFA
jgi:hypothetical protein